MELFGNLLGCRLRRDEADVSPSDHRDAEWVKTSGEITGTGPMRPIHDAPVLPHHWVSHVDTFPRKFLRRTQ